VFSATLLSAPYTVPPSLSVPSLQPWYDASQRLVQRSLTLKTQALAQLCFMCWRRQVEPLTLGGHGHCKLPAGSLLQLHHELPAVCTACTSHCVCFPNLYTWPHATGQRGTCTAHFQYVVVVVTRQRHVQRCPTTAVMKAQAPQTNPGLAGQFCWLSPRVAGWHPKLCSRDTGRSAIPARRRWQTSSQGMPPCTLRCH
jgi:hypothetical protein